MIDWARVTELRDEIGEEDFGDVVEIFLEEVEGALDALGDGSAALHEQLHFLKGSALNLGFQQFAELCQAGETSSADGDAEIDLDAVRRSYAASRDAFALGMQERYAA